MTISAFCRDQLLAQGPLGLETLAHLAADAGKTTVRNPACAVRSAISYKEVLLADGRWATPLWLLEGRILTARRLPLVEGWADLGPGDEDDDLLAYEDPDTAEGADAARHDLALLDRATKSGPHCRWLPAGSCAAAATGAAGRSRRAGRGCAPAETSCSGYASATDSSTSSSFR